MHDGTDFHGQHFDFIPIGSGRRQCPGLGLGALAVHLELANLLHAFEWSLTEELDMSEESSIVLRMRESPVVVSASDALVSVLDQNSTMMYTNTFHVRFGAEDSMEPGPCIGNGM